MKKLWKEILILLLQIFLFYIFPLFAGPTDVMGMVFVLIVGTFALGYFCALVIRWRGKWLWPVVAAMLFVPTIPIYYNVTAMIHTIWYLVVSSAGMVFGWLIRKLMNRK